MKWLDKLIDDHLEKVAEVNVASRRREKELQAQKKETADNFNRIMNDIVNSLENIKNQLKSKGIEATVKKEERSHADIGINVIRKVELAIRTEFKTSMQTYQAPYTAKELTIEESLNFGGPNPSEKKTVPLDKITNELIDKLIKGFCQSVFG